MGDLRAALEARFDRGDDAERTFREEVFEPFKTRIYVYVLRKLRYMEPDPISESEELTGNVLLKAWEQMSKKILFNEAWLYIVADHEVKNHKKYATALMRDVRRTQSFDQQPAGPDERRLTVGSIQTQGRSNPEEELIKKERQARIDEVIPKLPPLMRNALILYLKGYKYSSIAKMLNTSESNVKNAAYEARLALKRLLEKS